MLAWPLLLQVGSQGARHCTWRRVCGASSLVWGRVGVRVRVRPVARLRWHCIFSLHVSGLWDDGMARVWAECGHGTVVAPMCLAGPNTSIPDCPNPVRAVFWWPHLDTGLPSLHTLTQQLFLRRNAAVALCGREIDFYCSQTRLVNECQWGAPCDGYAAATRGPQQHPHSGPTAR